MKTLNQLVKGDIFFFCSYYIWAQKLAFFKIYTISEDIVDDPLNLRDRTFGKDLMSILRSDSAIDFDKEDDLRFCYSTDLQLMKNYLCSLNIDITKALDKIYQYENS